MKDKSILKKGTGAIARAGAILDLEPDKRVSAILDDPDPASLVRALPPQEFWITIKRTGVNDTVELLELASDEQLIFIQDVECWIGDKLDPARTLRWFEQIVACGPEKVAQWLRAIDADMFIVALRQFMLVTKPDEGTDPAEFADTIPPYTIDNCYYLHFFDEHYREIVGQILSLFAGLRFELYARMMEGMVWEVGPEMEVMARRWRDGRLRDLGIPDLDEAMAIYQYLDEARFRALSEKSSPVTSVEGYTVPRFPLMTPGARIFLNDALSLIPAGKALDGIIMEIAHLANRVVVTDSLDMSDASNLAQAVSKVRAVLSMGLETLAGTDIGEAAGLLKKKWLLHIFQVGYSRTLKLAKRADALYRTGWLKHVRAQSLQGVTPLLGHPLEQILSGLHRARPLLYIGGPEPYRFFENLQEVETSGNALDRIEYLGELFFNRLAIIKPDPSAWAWKRIYPVEINFETALRTALANAAAGRGFEFIPLRKSDIVKFIETAFEPVKQLGAIHELPLQKRRMKHDVKENLIAFLASRGTARNDTERRIRDDLVNTAIKFLEEELGRLDPERLEPKYIQGLVIRR